MPTARSLARSAPPWAAPLAALALTACAPRQQATPGPVATPAPEATADPGTVTWALASVPDTLDPSRMAVDPGALEVTAQVYDRLLGAIVRPDGTLGLTGALAESWETDVTGRSYTFVLREGLRFQDGTVLDAPAVRWNFERWMDPDHEAHQGIFRGWRAMFGGYVGETDASERPRNLVERVEALDARTVRITLRAPFAPFPNHIATAAFGIASPAAVRAQGDAYGSDGDHLPVGSGPFRVVGWNRADGIVELARNPAHWSGLPEAPGLRFVAIADDAARAEAVARGEVDGADLPATFPLTGTLAAPRVRVVARPARATAWLVLNVSRNPLGDERVRRAMSLAIDRAALARAHFGAQSLPAGQILPPGFAGHDPSIAVPTPDVARARALLAEADVAEGFRLNVWVPTMARPYLPDPEGAGEAVAAMLRAIGIDAQAESEPMRRLLDRRTSGRGTAWILGWEAQSLDPDNFWYWHFSPSRAPAEGQYVNESLGRLLLDAQQSIAPDVRERDYRAAAQQVSVDVPRIFLAHARPLVALSSSVAGFEPGPLGFDDFRAVTVARRARGGGRPTPAAPRPSVGAGTPMPTDEPTRRAEPLAPSTGSGTPGPATAQPTP